jgi:hypothetical protein
MTRFRSIALAVALGLSSACTQAQIGDGTGQNGNGSGTSGSAGKGGSLLDGMGKVPDAAPFASDAPRPGNGSAEVCNGIDDDDNGIVDDLDKDGDGVCDCLHIATLGVPGTWGQGNVFKNWLAERSTNGATDLGSQVLTAELLAPLQVIVAQDLGKLGRTYSADEVAAVKDWVQKGGGLMTLTGYGGPEDLANPNALLAPFGITYESGGCLPGGGGYTAPITNWADHPVSANVTQVGVDNGYPISGEGLAVASEQNITMGRAVESQAGRVFAWGDEWISYDSEWKDKPQYQVERLWLNVIKWLTPPKQCQVALPPIL